METQCPSPDGTYIFRIYPWEARMSLWVETPELIDVKTERSLLRCGDSNWSLYTAKWLDNHTVQVTLRKYPGNYEPSSIDVTIDCQLETAAIAGGETVELRGLEAEMNGMLKRVGG